jgi:hypothetical protein
MRFLINGFLILFGLNSCNNQQEFMADKDFLSHLDSYLAYVDSTKEYTNDFDYIYLESLIHNDSIDFVITLYGGSYTFLKEKARIRDFISYKAYNILFIGDFPNEIVHIRQNNHLDVTEDIVKRFYSNDFIKYKNDTLSVGPLTFDYMAMYLTYRNGKLISEKRQYY